MATRSLLLSLVCLHSASGQPPKAPDKAMLSEAETRRLIAALGDGDVPTGKQLSMPLPQRVAVPSERIAELYKAKRIETLRTLLQLTREGATQQARSAGVTAMALECDPALAVIWQDGDLADFDKPRIGVPSHRTLLANEVQAALQEAEVSLRKK